MSLQDLVIHSQLIPPRQRKGVLRRPRLEARLAAILDYPLTLVQAGTGYGKSTALAALPTRDPAAGRAASGAADHLFWYSIAEPDRDPLLFLVHLICAVLCREPAWGEPALAALEASGGRVTRAALTPLLNTLARNLEGEAVLVLDDYHLVADVPDIAALVEQLVDYAPDGLHVVVASRYPPAFAALNRWRVKDRVLIIGREDLTFTVDEVEALFRDHYRYPLSPAQAQALLAETEGWAMALSLVWQSLQAGSAPDIDAVLGRLPSTFEALFDYLAQDVLGRQPAAVQRFMLATSVLRQMDGPVCDALLDVEGSGATLRRLYESGLFLASVGDDRYRYQRLFHDFLQVQLGRERDRARSLHLRAAAYYGRAGHPEEQVYHLLQAQEFGPAAALLCELGPGLIATGRLESLAAWITALPAAVRTAEPRLDLMLGDVLRLRAEFDEALSSYLLAGKHFEERGDRLGRSQALRGQAQVYLDTIRPLKAGSLLEEALHLLEPQEYRQETAALLDQLAENKLNLGDPDQAEALHHEARLLRAEVDPGDIYLEARAMLRTGRLVAGRRLLEERAEGEQRPARSRPQRFHRETVLLLSLLSVLSGDGPAAERYARQGVAIGQQLHSSFVEAVGYMRLGHALQLGGLKPWSDWEQRQAIAHYVKAIDLVRPFKVMRVQAEPLWGLCRAHGFRGDWTSAAHYADQALEAVERAGDEWMGDLVRVTLGASYALAGRAEAAGWLERARSGFGQVGDPFGQCEAWLWLALNDWRQGNMRRAMDGMAALLPLAAGHGYDCLWLRPTFLGPDDPQAAIPLLLEARRQGIERVYVQRLLCALGLAGTDYHPGYTLSVRTLGPFAVWRGAEPLAARDWQREKARQIFQLFLTERGQWLYREQVVEKLWPHLPPEAAERDFKVALTALNHALEPGRPSGAAPFFLVRHGAQYGLNPAARLAVDSDRLERLAGHSGLNGVPGALPSGESERSTLQHVLALYEEDYLPDCLYEDWSAPTRDRLRGLYLAAAERLAGLALQAGEWEEAVDVAQAMLARDNCWEPAYRLLMRAYAGQGNRAQVRATYERCRSVLAEELGVDPSPDIQTMMERD
jgi:DNA-binding SARP family transcriptional activator